MLCKKGATALPLQSIHEHHTDDLEEGDDEEGNGAHVAVEDLQPVVPRAQGEDQGH